MENITFPYEVYFNIENEDHLCGSIIIDKIGKKYTAEISIVQRESKKIYRHIKNLYNYEDYHEIFETSVDLLTKFLQKES